MGEFVWVAKYRNNTYKKANDGTSFDNIPRKNLWLVDMISPTNKKILTLTFKPGYNVFYRRRAAMTQGAGMDVVHIIGYQIKNSEVSAVAFLYESDWRIDIGDFKQANESLADYKEYKGGITMLPGDLEEIVWD